MKRREFGKPIPMYLIEEDRLQSLLELEHRYLCRKMNEDEIFDYFWNMMVGSGLDQHVTRKEFIKAVENMTFEGLAELDLALYEEYHEKCGNECQFKFKQRPNKAPVDNH